MRLVFTESAWQDYLWFQEKDRHRRLIPGLFSPGTQPRGVRCRYRPRSAAPCPLPTIRYPLLQDRYQGGNELPPPDSPHTPRPTAHCPLPTERPSAIRVAPNRPWPGSTPSTAWGCRPGYARADSRGRSRRRWGSSPCRAAAGGRHARGTSAGR